MYTGEFESDENIFILEELDCVSCIFIKLNA